MRKILLLALLLALIGAPVFAQSPKTYYADYVGGSNSNDGLSQSTPWKSFPGMPTGASCAGPTHSYTHVAGDHFIFKLGVTWPAACFHIVVLAGGTSSVQDYWGVWSSTDKYSPGFGGTSWGSGSFAIWDLNFTRPQGDQVVTGPVTTPGFGFITFDGFEIKNQAIVVTNGIDQQQAYSFRNFSNASQSPLGIIVANGFIHGWGSTTTLTSSNQSYYSAGSISGNVTVDNTEISDADGWMVTSGTPAHFGGAVTGVTNNVGVSEVKNSKIHDTMAACFNVRSCHGNEFYNIQQPTGDAGGALIHSQVIEDDDGWGPTQAFNNLIHDINAGVVMDLCQGASVYNTVVYNNTNNFILRIAGTGAGNCGAAITSIPTSIYNNSWDCHGNSECFATDSHTGAAITGAVNLQNNQFITNSGNGVTINEPITGTFTNTNNIVMSSATATAQNYTIATKFRAAGATVAAGINRNTFCVGTLGPLCQDAEGTNWFGQGFVLRQTGTTAWDVGAYQSPFSGGGGTPSISLSPSPAAFGNQRVGVTSSPVTVTVSNVGTAPQVLATPFFTITGTNASSFANAGTGTCVNGGSIAASSSCTVNLTFTPFSSGALSATLTINGTVSATDSLTGTGIAPIIGFAPSPVSFGNQAVGSTSSPVTVTISNTGTASEILSTPYFTITGTNAADFANAGTGTCSNAGTIATSSSCTVNLTVTPGGQGARVAQFNLSGTVNGIVSLTATGTQAVASLSPASITFANQNTGTSSGNQTETLTNTGNSTLTITSIALTGANANQFSTNGSTCGGTLGASASCTINVVFSPTSIGAKVAALAYTTSAASSPNNVPLAGTGVTPGTPSLSFSPSPAAFANQNIATTSGPLTITVSNVGNAAETLSTPYFTISGTNPTNFANAGTGTCANGATIAISGSCTIIMSFSPSATGARSGVLTVNGTVSATDTLTGTGTQGIITITPSPIAFGNQNVGTTSAPTTVTLTNTGTGNATVSGITVTGPNASDFTATPTTLTPSGPITITGQNGTVIKGLRITSTTGDCVTINGSSTNITIEQSEIGPCTGGSEANGIRVSGGTTINIYDNYIHQTNTSSTCCDTHDGIFATNGISGLNIRGNIIAYGESNIEVQDSSNISVIGNFFVNPLDSNPTSPPNTQSRGQNFQCWEGGSSTGCTSVTFQNNYTLSSADTFTYAFAGNQEDSVNFGFTNTATVSGNFVTGGTSPSGCGMIADNSANSITFSTNRLLNTGQCGIGIADGTNNVVNANKIYNTLPVAGGGNTAIYAWKQYTAACGPTTISNNIADALAVGGAHNTYFDGGGCSPTLTSNTFDAAADSSLTPVATVFAPPSIPPASVSCAMPSPFTNNTSVAACSLPVILAPNGTLTVPVTFTPAASGSRTATFNVQGTAPASAALTGTGVGSFVTLAPTSIAFGNQNTGTTSTNVSVSLTNTGSATLNISSITLTGANANQFGTNGSTCSSSLAPSASCSLNVTFAPTTVGSKTASLTFATDAASSPDNVPLTGTGTSAGTPSLSFSPTPVAFGNQNVGTTSAPTTVTVSNTGTANEVLATPYFNFTGANATSFAVATGGTCANGITIAPSASCTVNLTFTPSTTGSLTGVFNILGTVNGGNNLSGTGGPLPAVTLSPTSINFGNQQSGTTSGPTNVRLTNSGGATLTITSILVTGANATEFSINTSTCGPTLAASAFCTWNVVFSPTSVASKTAAVTITTNAPSNPDTVSLSGTGTSPVVPTTPAPALTIVNALPPGSAILSAPGSGVTPRNFLVSPTGCSSDGVTYSNPCIFTINCGNCSSTTQVSFNGTSVPQSFASGVLTVSVPVNLIPVPKVQTRYQLEILN